MATGPSRKLLAFALALGTLVVVLRVGSCIPSTVDEQGIERYATLDGARNQFRPDRLYLPSVVPKSLAWPPAEILVRRSPAPAAVIHFRAAGGDRIVLGLVQQRGDGAALPTRIEPTRVLHSEAIELDGHPAELDVALCEDLSPCNRIRFADGPYRLELVGRIPLEELRRIAASLSPEHGH